MQSPTSEVSVEAHRAIYPWTPGVTLHSRTPEGSQGVGTYLAPQVHGEPPCGVHQAHNAEMRKSARALPMAQNRCAASLHLDSWA
jgi:hypothetical protein